MADDTHPVFTDGESTRDAAGQVWAEYGFGTPKEFKVEADRFALRFGSVVVDLTHIGTGRITVDGRPLKCTRLEVVCVPGQMPEVLLSLLPVPDDALKAARPLTPPGPSPAG